MSEPFNNLQSTLTLLHTRRSGKARDMEGPGLTADELDQVLAAALRVPDHGKLAPWRFVIVPQARRDALADVIETAYRAEKPSAGQTEIDAVRAYALQGPTLIAVLSTPKTESHIPLWEQHLSAGAACQNLLVAAHALGYVGNWLTGWPAYNTSVIAALGGGPADRIAGFMYLGGSTKDLVERPRPERTDVIRVW